LYHHGYVMSYDTVSNSGTLVISNISNINFIIVFKYRCSN
jgi:hypothetical protein